MSAASGVAHPVIGATVTTGTGPALTTSATDPKKEKNNLISTIIWAIVGALGLFLLGAAVWATLGTVPLFTGLPYLSELVGAVAALVTYAVVGLGLVGLSAWQLCCTSDETVPPPAGGTTRTATAEGKGPGSGGSATATVTVTPGKRAPGSTPAHPKTGS